jgi:hypothetical protein
MLSIAHGWLCGSAFGHCKTVYADVQFGAVICEVAPEEETPLEYRAKICIELCGESSRGIYISAFSANVCTTPWEAMNECLGLLGEIYGDSLRRMLYNKHIENYKLPIPPDHLEWFEGNRYSYNKKNNAWEAHKQHTTKIYTGGGPDYVRCDEHLNIYHENGTYKATLKCTYKGSVDYSALVEYSAETSYDTPWEAIEVCISKKAIAIALEEARYKWALPDQERMLERLRKMLVQQEDS